MVNQLRRPTKVSELAAILGLKWSGLDLNITHVQSIDLVDDGAQLNKLILQSRLF